jgi:hypothetical protein
MQNSQHDLLWQVAHDFDRLAHYLEQSALIADASEIAGRFERVKALAAQGATSVRTYLSREPDRVSTDLECG